MQLADLFTDEPFLLLLGHFLTNALLDLDHHIFVVVGDGHEGQQLCGHVVQRFRFQEVLLFGQGNLQEGDNPVKGIQLAVHAKEGIYHAFGNVPLGGIVPEVGKHVTETFGLVLVANRNFPGGYRHMQESVFQYDRTQVHNLLAFQHHLHAAVGERRHVAYVGGNAYRVQVQERVGNFFLLNILLGHQNNFAIVGLGVFQGAERNIAAHQNTAGRKRENNSVPQRQKREYLRKIKSHISIIVKQAKPGVTPRSCRLFSRISSRKPPEGSNPCG